MSIANVLLVHGYSVRDFKSYGQYSALLAEALNLTPSQVFVSAFDSLNNQVTCDDLSRALELRIKRLEQARLIDISNCALLCHSTGSIIARRWILDRLNKGQACPSHFVSLAGANHGSTVAQLGETQLVQFGRQIFQGSSVGLNILSDLDYGSKFLLRLNREWINAQALGAFKTYIFSLIGDKYGANAPLLPSSMPVFWQVKEKGSDATVRISGSNLNYRMFSRDFSEVDPQDQILSTPDTAHLILPGYSHTGTDGILERAASMTDNAFQAVLAALNVSNSSQYQTLINKWNSLNDAWSNTSTPQKLVNSTVVFNISVPGTQELTDFVITIQDGSGNARNISSAILDHQPTQNSTNKSSLTFYLDYSAFNASHPHMLNIEVHNSYDKMQYRSVDVVIPAALAQLVRPNQCTYVELVLDESSFHILPSNDPAVTDATRWPPLPGI
jgi:hypothetical protein